MNDKLLELKRKKLQRQILYLRTELEETTFIFQDCLIEFEDEFRDYFKDQSNKDHKKVTTDPPEFDIPENGATRLSLFDLTGREVMTIIDRDLTAGHYRLQLDGSDLVSGIYIYQIHFNGQQESYLATRKLILLK